MGSCISKCRPKKHFHIQEDQFDHVQDKQVISQLPPPPPPPRSAPIPAASSKISPSPPSPSHSTSSASSFTCSSTSASTTSASNTSSLSSISTLSSASSVLSSKDRSFSNEFLWSCYKENPHITRINSIKEATFSPQKPVLAAVKKKQQQPNPKRASGSSTTTPQKRVRPSSPTPLTRQKSFRRDPPERPIMISAPHSLPSRTLLMRSPSPSRRFMMANPNPNPNPAKDQSHWRKENLGPAGPNINRSSRVVGPGLKSRETETYIHRISSKIDEVAVREALAEHYLESLHAEDIDNPLISLDCFIFL